jgi:tetratricopeptide (TPR) repeat protein
VLDTSLVQAELERILSTPPFQRSPKQSAFLRFVVEKTLAGEAGGLKEFEIGTQVYGRGPKYDNRQDPIVRVEGSRLRAKLAEYYLALAEPSPVRISIPRGSYEAHFEFAAATAPVPVVDEVAEAKEPPPSAPAKRWGLSRRTLTAVAVLLVAMILLAVVRWRQNGKTALPSKIAILPISNAGGEANVVAALLGDMLGGQLERTAVMAVIPKAQVAGHTQDFAYLERSLGAGAVLEGSVQKYEGRYRAKLRMLLLPERRVLAEADSESEEADGSMASSDLAAHLLRRMIPEAQQNLQFSAEQWQQIQARGLEGERWMLRRDGGSLQRAVLTYAQLKQDFPALALAQAKWADASLLALAIPGQDSLPLRQQIETAIERSFELQPVNAAAYLARIRWLRLLKFDLQAAQVACKEARRYQAENVEIGTECARVEMALGRYERAQGQLQAIRQQSPKLLDGIEALAALQLQMGRYQEAVDRVAELRRSFPDAAVVERLEARAQLGLGQWQEALRACETGRRRDPEGRWYWDAYSAYAQAKLGKPTPAEILLGSSEAFFVTRAWAALALGQNDKVKSNLQLSKARGEMGMMEFATDPMFRDALR